MLPLYEAKMIHHYDTRWATYTEDGSTRLMTEEEKAERVPPMPRYWVSQEDVDSKLDGKWDKQWLLGWRRISRSTDERTLIASMTSCVGVGDSIFLLLPSQYIARRNALQMCMSSFVFDFVARQKMGGTNTNFFFLEQLPMASPTLLELEAHTAYIEALVDRLNGFIPNIEERRSIRAELDAYAFHLYGINRDDASYILDTFPIVKRKDEAEFGEYVTKRLILEEFDRLAEQIGGIYCD